MKLNTENYLAQQERWPQEGQHILALFNEESVVVYQAYRPAIGHYAIQHGRLDGPHFSLNRMSWIKPNFLWMMYRSGWATKPGQQIILGLRIRRSFFEAVLRQAVPSSFDPARYENQAAWKQAVETSEVRLQWDPDHAPDGAKLPRRAIQLGLRGAALRCLASSELLEVIDMTEFVEEQRQLMASDLAALLTPLEQVFPWPESVEAGQSEAKEVAG